MSYLSVKDLKFRYPGQDPPALGGVNLAVEQGEMMALVGPNAAGKSTLARLLKGLLKPLAGTISIGGRRTGPEGPDRRVALVQSNPENAIVSTIVREDVAFSLEVLGVRPAEIQSRVMDVLVELGILELSQRMPHRLSGGEMQLVALAGALVSDPEVLVLDEPTAFIDPPGRERVIAALEGLCRKGKAVLFITHDMEEAARADRIALISRGEILAQERPEILFADGSLVREGRLTRPFASLLTEGLSREGLAVPCRTARFGPLVAALVSSTGAAREAAIKRTAPPAVPPWKDAVLSYRSVHFSYRTAGPRELLRGVDMAAPEGKVTVLAGTNGSGKSTLLQMSNALIVPDRGEVLFRSRPLAALRGKRGGIPAAVGLLFQHPERQVFAESVFEDIAFGPRNLGMREGDVRARVLDAIAWTGLSEDVLDRSPFQLSGGQLRRVAIAGVLALGSDVLVLDEPADGLEPAGAEELWNGLKNLTNQRFSSVLVGTHQVPDSIAMISHLAVLSEGSVSVQGPPGLLAGGSAPQFFQLAPPHVRAQAMLAAAGLHLAEPGLSKDHAVRVIVDALKRREGRTVGQESP